MEREPSVLWVQFKEALAEGKRTVPEKFSKVENSIQLILDRYVGAVLSRERMERCVCVCFRVLLVCVVSGGGGGLARVVGVLVSVGSGSMEQSPWVGAPLSAKKILTPLCPPPLARPFLVAQMRYPRWLFPQEEEVDHHSERATERIHPRHRRQLHPAPPCVSTLGGVGACTASSSRDPCVCCVCVCFQGRINRVFVSRLVAAGQLSPTICVQVPSSCAQALILSSFYFLAPCARICSGRSPTLFIMHPNPTAPFTS
jgi:hypothetical protein